MLAQAIGYFVLTTIGLSIAVVLLQALIVGLRCLGRR
jgi:hypothetical protein